MRLNPVQIEQSSIIWVLIADGRRAQIYRYHPHITLIPMHGSKREPYEEGVKRHELTPVPDMHFEAELLNNFQVSHDSRGSKIGGSRPGHNTCEPHLDIHDEVKQNLVKEIADKLRQAWEVKAFDDLVIAASPKILGALRAKLDVNILSHVVAEIDRDFTHDRNQELFAHLQNTLRGARIS